MKKFSLRFFPELIFCTAVSWGLSVNLFAGYDMGPSLSQNLAAVALVVLLAEAVLLFVYRLRYGKAAALCVTLFGVLIIIVSLFQSDEFSDWTVIDRNPLLFWIIIMCASILVFWLSRTKAGIAFLLLSGTFLTVAFDFLKYPVLPAGFFSFLTAMIALYFIRIHAAIPSDTEDLRKNGESLLLRPVLIALMAVLIGAGIFYTAVKPFAAVSDNTELAQKLMSMQIMEQLGIATTKIVYTEQPPEEELQKEQEPDKISEQIREEQIKQNKEGRVGKSGNLADILAVTYKKAEGILLIAIPVAAGLLILAVALKRFLRKKWYKDLLGGTKEEGALTLYGYFLKRLRSIGLIRRDGFTLLEFVADSQEILSRFTVYDTDFMKLTEIYQKIIYGYQQISEHEFELFQDFYTEFRRNLRKEMGSVKYLLRYFKI